MFVVLFFLPDMIQDVPCVNKSGIRFGMGESGVSDMLHPLNFFRPSGSLSPYPKVTVGLIFVNIPDERFVIEFGAMRRLSRSSVLRSK